MNPILKTIAKDIIVLSAQAVVRGQRVRLPHGLTSSRLVASWVRVPRPGALLGPVGTATPSHTPSLLR